MRPPPALFLVLPEELLLLALLFSAHSTFKVTAIYLESRQDILKHLFGQKCQVGTNWYASW